jgi:hypothetical protein
MKTLITVLSLSLASFVVSGCSESHAAHSRDHAAEPTPACSYKEGMGLELTQAGAKFIGLQTAEFDGKLPKESLLRTAKGDFVFVQNGGRYLRTPVKVAATDNRTFELMEGLYEGDTIVVQGARGLWLAELQAVNGGVGCADGH